VLSLLTILANLFQPFCCRGAFRKCLHCPWNLTQWSKYLSYFL